jgi:GntR family transcriptional regulator, transcriptional repressor for pyruvate dehydrogenase complex
VKTAGTPAIRTEDGEAALERFVQFHPVPTRQAWEAAADALRAKIDLGLIQPERRLPSERELAEQMGVSRITVSQALRVLQGEGLIEPQGRTGGARVRPPRVRRSEEVLEELVRRRSEIDEILGCRTAVESQTARLAAERLASGVEQIDLSVLSATMVPLDSAAAALEQARLLLVSTSEPTFQATTREEWRDAGITFRREDSLFHLGIAEAGGNRRLVDLVERLGAEFFAPVEPTLALVNFKTVGIEHRQILDAISQGDPRAAEDAMRNHIESIRQAINTAFAS